MGRDDWVWDLWKRVDALKHDIHGISAERLEVARLLSTIENRMSETLDDLDAIAEVVDPPEAD